MNKHYTIDRGDHRSGIFFSPTFNSYAERNIEFMFDSNCYFKKTTPADFAINKLFGFSFGFHHRNSIRIGWMPSDTHNKIALYVYYYNRGIRSSQFICDVNCYTYNIAKIKCDYNNNSFDISITNSENITIKLNNVGFQYPNLKIGYFLFPYFGGNNTAPCRMNFVLDYDHKSKKNKNN